MVRSVIVDPSPPANLVAEVSDVITGTIESVPWDCDIRAILSPLIDSHQAAYKARGEEPEAGFCHHPPLPKLLATLIGEDAAFLTSMHGLLSNIEPVGIIEANSQEPNAQLIRIKQGDAERSIIAFHTPIIWYMNAFFTKLDLLNGLDIYSGCLAEHRKDMESERYSDISLIVQIYDEMEVLVNREFFKRPISPPFLGSPFDVCERVEGARRFVVAHELSHAVADQPFAQKITAAYRKMLMESLGDALSAERIAHWAEELWCDESGVAALNFLYFDQLDDPAQLHQATNALQGVITFFFMMHLLEAAFERKLMSHNFPPVAVRYESIRHVIKGSHLFRNDHIRNMVIRYHARMASALAALGATGFHPRVGNIHLYMHQATNDFGKRFYRAVFDRLRVEESPWSHTKGGFDRE